MGQGIGEVLTWAVGVAISPIPIIAVILMLFSARARVNGTAFLSGWILSLAAVSTVVYVLAHDGNVATSTTAADSVSWGKIVLGAALVLLALRNWRTAAGSRGRARDAQVDGRRGPDVAGQGVRPGGRPGRVNPKNLLLTLGSATGLAQLGLSTADAIVAIVVFVVIASLSIAVPVAYAVFGGAKAKTTLESAKTWLTAHNAAVMAVLFLVFGVDLIAKGLPTLTH